MSVEGMDRVDRDLLNIIQTGFPIDARPYDVLGKQLGICKEEALRRVRALHERGIIRRIGPSFDSRKLGHVSTLVAAKAPPERLEEVAAIVSAVREVTHNYGRDFEYNLWFTVVCESHERLDEIVEQVKSETGITDMHVLPAENVFKIRVDFEF